MNKPDGGPAFPVIASGTNTESDGMTLRDYFAAKSMQTYRGNVGYSPQKIAQWAYEDADAMLAERDK